MEALLKQQRNEITEYHIYSALAELAEDEQNRQVLRQIAEEEKKHYAFWEKLTGRSLAPQMWKVRLYVILARIFGLSFALRLMERGEEEAIHLYRKMAERYPEAKAILEEELRHEDQLIGLLSDDRLRYAGALVLGLNDALVEFTGTLAGLSFAFSKTIIIATTGIIMGIAASLSMAASGYLASREYEDEEIHPIKSAVYTGVAYILTVCILVMPYFFTDNPRIGLVGMLFFTILIIAAYTFYISIAKGESFGKRFSEMAFISLTVALISFGIGSLIKYFFDVEV